MLVTESTTTPQKVGVKLNRAFLFIFGEESGRKHSFFSFHCKDLSRLFFFGLPLYVNNIGSAIALQC